MIRTMDTMDKSLFHKLCKKKRKDKQMELDFN